MKPRFCLCTRATADRAYRAEPEDSPKHGGVLKQLLLLDRQPVEARRDDALHVLGQRELLAAAALCDQARELLRVERIAARPREERRLKLSR